jgi:uncharacterized repeat protein (TIGR02543 family)
MKLKFHRTIISMMMIIVMIAGMTQGMGGRAKAGTPGVYKITFNGDGGTLTTTLKNGVTVGAGQLCSIPSDKPTRKNYTFLGWSTSPNSKVVDPNYLPGMGNIRLSGNITLYAVWAGPGTYVISFRTNGISGISNMPVDFQIGAGCKYSIPSTIPKRYGFEFDGWSTSPTATKGDPAYAPGKGNILATKNLTLYPVWKFSDGGGVAYGIIITVKKKSNNTVVGQFSIPSPRNVSVSELNSFLVNKKNIKIPDGYHRDWFDVNQKYFNTSVYISKSTTVYYNDAPNRQAYQFIGPDGKIITASSGNPIITLQTGDTFKSKVNDPSAPYKVFLGWSLKKNGGPIDGLYMSDHKCFFEKDNPGQIITLYACCWNETSYSVKYIMNKTEVTDTYDAVHKMKNDIDSNDAKKIKNKLAEAIPFIQKVKDLVGLFVAKDIRTRLTLVVVGWVLNDGKAALSKDSDTYKALAKSDTLMKNCKNSMGANSEVLVTFDVKYKVPAEPNHIYPTLDMGTTFMLPTAYQ